MTDYETVLSPQPLFLNVRCQASPCIPPISPCLAYLISPSDFMDTENTSTFETTSQTNSTRNDADDDNDVEFTPEMYSNVEKFFDDEGLYVISVEEASTPKPARGFVQLKRLPNLLTETSSQGDNKETLAPGGCISRILAARKARTAIGMLGTSSASKNFAMWKRAGENYEAAMESPLA